MILSERQIFLEPALVAFSEVAAHKLVVGRFFVNTLKIYGNTRRSGKTFCGANPFIGDI